MRRWLGFLFTFLILGQAQESPIIGEDTVGIVSYLDISLSVDEACLSTALLECLPHIEVIDLSQFEYCQEHEDIGDCSQDYAYQVPFISTEQSEAIEEELKEHWVWYDREVIRIYSDHIWESPPCINFAAHCPDPGIDWGCLLRRLADALAEVLSETQPEYWRKVYESVVTHVPFALWYRLPYPPLPDGGAIISPVSALEPQLSQYYDLIEQGDGAVDKARRGAYYFQDPAPGLDLVDLPIAYTQEEIDDLSGGIQAYEIDKTALETATLLEQQHSGFATMFSLWDEVTTVVHFSPLAGPYAPGWCSTLEPPYTGPTITPIPAVVYPTNEARVGYGSVPEGYSVERVGADPLLAIPKN